MMQKLWGDNFFDAGAKKWKKQNLGEDGSKLKRAYCQFVLDPIVKVFSACMAGKKDNIAKMLKALGVVLKHEEMELEQKKLIKSVMQKWMNAADALLEMMVLHLPSPKTSQK